MKYLRLKCSILGLCLVAMFACTNVDASIDVGFYKLTNNNTEDLSSQLNVRLYDATEANSTFGLGLVGNDVLFALTNDVGIQSNVAEWYIDDGTVVGLSAVHNSLGGFTNFNDNGTANPGNLPGGNAIGFVATSGFSADVLPGPPPNGVDQAADIVGFQYATTAGFSDVVAAIGDGRLRIGLHIRSIGVAGGSDSYVNRSLNFNLVPEPGTAMVWTVLAGLGMVVSGRRRR